MSMTIVAGIMEIVESPLYDTLALPLELLGGRGHLFEHPLGAMFPLGGAQSRPKTNVETNLFEPGSLPAPQKFVVFAIRAALFSQAGALLPVSSPFYRGAALRFWINQKPYWTGPLWKVADPAALFAFPFGLSSFNSDERIEIIRSLRWTFTDIKPLIDSGESFGVQIDFDPVFGWTDTAAPGSLVVLLEGEHGRAVV
jgi:hypothetical protein